MNTYIVLLRKMEGRTGEAVEATPLHQMPEIEGIQILDVFAVAGIFEVVLTCRAPTNRTVAKLLNALAGWHTDALLATEHIRFETISASGSFVTH
jgi:hypothetical protein